MPAEDAAPIFERLEEHEQEELIEQMPPESVAEIASEMSADNRADLFSVLPVAMGEQLFEALEKVDPEAAQEVRDIEKWPETSAGHLMTPDFVQVSPRMRVSEALETVRSRARERDEFVYVVYALERGRLEGVASLRDLLIADPLQGIAEIMRTNVISVPPTMDQEEVARRMAKYDLNVIPVVGDDSRVLGVITIDDIIDVLVQEQTEDVQRIGAVEPLDLPYFQTSFTTFIRKRAGWLIVLFVEEFFTQTALRHYDPVMEAVKGALLYVPLLISAGGNSGSQSSTLIIRGLALGEVKLTDWWRILIRESIMGVLLGIIIAVIAMGRVMMYPDQSFLLRGHRRPDGALHHHLGVHGGLDAPHHPEAPGHRPGHELDPLHREPRRHPRRRHLRPRRHARDERHHPEGPAGALRREENHQDVRERQGKKSRGFGFV